MKIAAPVHIGRRVHDLENGTGDQIPVVGQRERKNRLKLKVYKITIRLVQPVGIFLELERPNT